MWLSNLLRKLSKGPAVGETFRHHIGCYLFGTEQPGTQHCHYITMPTSLPALEHDVRTYLQGFVQEQGSNPCEEVQLVRSVLADLPARLRDHVNGNMQQPFLSMPGVHIFIRTGIRERARKNGEFLE